MNKWMHRGLLAAIAVLSILMAIGTVALAATRLEPVLVTVDDGSGSWKNTGGDMVRLAAVTSSATGGTLTVSVSLGVTRADSAAATLQLGAAVIVPPTNITVSVGSTAYVWPQQTVTLEYGTNITDHTVFLTVEKTE